MKNIWKFFEDNTTPLLVLLSFLICIIFTIICLVLSTQGVNVQDTLIEWVFKFFGLELLALSGIKVSKHIGSAFGRIESDIELMEETINGVGGEEDE